MATARPLPLPTARLPLALVGALAALSLAACSAAEPSPLGHGTTGAPSSGTSTGPDGGGGGGSASDGGGGSDAGGGGGGHDGGEVDPDGGGLPGSDAGGHDGGDAASGVGKFGDTCTTDADCASKACFVGGQGSYCSIKCATNADCPVPPTSGTCNLKGYCKK